MPETLGAVLVTPGLGWMALAILAAGIVRGFTGFGTALIFVPVAAQFLPLAEVVLIMAVTGLFSAAVLVPGAWRVADKKEVANLFISAAITVPLGVWLLTVLDAITIRWIVVGIATVTLAAIITGWRWHGTLSMAGRLAIGGTTGIMGGMTGLMGPVVIIFYLANARRAEAVRANTIVFLAAADVLLVANLGLGGLAEVSAVLTALVLTVPYLIFTRIGQALFNPGYEKTYRAAAYAVIGLAVISGLPILD